jgi:TRAP-type C4-dicarboxylate transport system substrate-binding protein
MLANKRSFEKLPADIQQIIARNFDLSAVAQRADVERLTLTARADLEKAGMKFNTVDQTGFRDKLRANGFYQEWKTKLGKEAWDTLEASVGKMG